MPTSDAFRRGIAIAFAVAGFVTWLWPGFNGFFFSPSDMSAGDGRIIGAIFDVGAALIWFMRPAPRS